MNDIFKNMQVSVGCGYLSDFPSYKRKVWQEKYIYFLLSIVMMECQSYGI